MTPPRIAAPGDAPALRTAATRAVRQRDSRHCVVTRIWIRLVSGARGRLDVGDLAVGGDAFAVCGVVCAELVGGPERAADEEEEAPGEVPGGWDASDEDAGLRYRRISNRSQGYLTLHAGQALTEHPKLIQRRLSIWKN